MELSSIRHQLSRITSSSWVSWRYVWSSRVSSRFLLILGSEQEYDAQNEMIDDSEVDTPSGGGPYPPGFNTSESNHPLMLSPATSNGAGHHLQDHIQSVQPTASGGQYPSMTQLLDQNLDWDPFGLSASMAFPTQQFQFGQSSMR